MEPETERTPDREGLPPEAAGVHPPASPVGRALRWAGIALVVLVVAALVVAFVLPRHAVVTRTVEIAAPPSVVFPLVGDLRRFNEWSPWAELDPETAYTFTGPADGVGQTLNWDGPSEAVGRGSLSIAAIEPESRVDLVLAFEDAGTALASVAVEPAGAGSRVTWSFDSDLGFNPIARYFGMMADGVVGPDYEKGLARLKALAEAPPVAAADE